MTREVFLTKWRDEVTDLSDAYDLIDQIFDEHEAQLKAKDKDIQIVMDMSKNLLNELKTERDIKKYLIKDLKKQNKARSIVAMLFWEWKKAKNVVKKHEQKGEDVSYGKTVMYAREQMFKKAYSMLKDKQ